MQTKLLTLLFISVLVLPLKIAGQHHMLIPKKDDKDEYGYVNQFGDKMIDYRYGYAGAFYGEMAVVKTDSFYYINREGVIVSPGYELAYPFFDNFTIVGRNGRFAFIDKDFKPVKNQWFDRAYLFQMRYATAQAGKNKYLLAENGRLMRVGSNYKIPVQGRIMDVAEKMPHFPGGAAELNEYLEAKLPDKLLNSLLYMSFVVEKDGSLSGITVMGEVSEQQRQQIVAVFSGMPAWIPGRQGNESVRVKMNIPLFMNSKSE